MLIPNPRAPIAMKLIYPANSHVEQQIDFLPKWIECIQSNHHPAERVQINLAWLLCLLFISPQLPVPKSTHSTLILFFFLHLNETLAFAPRTVGRFPCLLSYGGRQTGVGEPHELPFPEDALAHLLWHVWQKLWEGSQPQKTISFNPPYYHATAQWAQRSLHSFWNNKQLWDELSLIEQSLLIMGSSFPLFTTFSRFPERREEETFELPRSISSCGGTSVALGAILSCEAICGGQPELHTDPASAVTL